MEQNVFIPVPDPKEQGPEMVSGITDWFDTLPTTVGIESCRDEFIQPQQGLQVNNQSINFRFQASNDEALDMSQTRLCMDMRINLANGDDLPNNVNNIVTTTNGIGHAFWKNITVRVNGETITNSDNMYAHRGDLYTRLNYTGLIQDEGSLTLAGFDEESQPVDSFADENACTPWRDAAVKDGLTRRYRLHRVPFRITSPVHTDICQQDKLLPPNTVVEMIFERNSDAFCLVTKHANADYKLNLVSCQLKVHFKKLNAELLNAALKKQMQGYRLLFPLERISMTYFTRIPNTTDWSEPHPLYGQGNILPSKIYMALVKQTAFTGAYDEDPFNYVGDNLGEVCLRLSGETKPYPMLKMHRGGVGDNTDIIEPLSALLQSMGVLFDRNKRTHLNIYNYHNRNFIFGWDLNPNPQGSKNTFNLPDTRQAELHMLLRQAYNQAHTLIVYSVYPSELALDNEGKVKLSENAT